MENKTEYRFLRNSELRAAGAGKIEGYAAVFGQYSQDLGGYKEKIRAGAFRNSLGTNDVVALYNHETGSVLGRVSARTMRLSETDVGLKTSIDLPSTTLGKDVYELVLRGDLKGMSFGFHIVKDEWKSSTERELIEVDCHEISVTPFPAYRGTSIEARALGLPADAQFGTYSGVVPVPVSDEEKMRLQLRLDLLRRL